MSTQLLRLSAIRQGKEDQRLTDLNNEEHSEEEAAQINARVNGLSNDELASLLRGGLPEGVHPSNKKPRD